MKTLMPFVLLSLLCSLQLSSAAPAGPSIVMQGDCCPKYDQTMIPRGRVTDVATTPSSCSQKAIIVTTVCGRKHCIDPDWIWAKKLLAEFQKVGKKSPFAQFKPSNCEKRA